MMDEESKRNCSDSGIFTRRFPGTSSPGPTGSAEWDLMTSPLLAGQVVVVVDESRLVQAWEYVSSCEGCVDSARLPFDYLLEAVMGGDPSTQYLMWRAATCPSCGGDIHEKTRIVPC